MTYFKRGTNKFLGFVLLDRLNKISTVIDLQRCLGSFLRRKENSNFKVS